MNISAIPAPAPVNLPDAAQPKAADPASDGETKDASTAQPAAPAPLPPGQGTRIDQIC
jgi:hypothetical protein